MNTVSHDDIRLSDNERMTALQALGTHFADGRLDISEFNERTEKAAVARTRGELRPLFDDLPGGLPLDSNTPVPVQEDPAVAELANLKRKGDLIRKLDIGFGAVAGLIFFLGLWLGWSYSWVALIVASAAAGVYRNALGYDSSEEKAFTALQKKEAKAKEQRLLQAQERLKELGS